MTTVEDVLARLSKETSAKIRLASDISEDRLPIASFGLNMTTGGLGIGKQHTWWGNEQAGKSAILLQTIALNQKNGVVCGYIDAERTLNKNWARRLGVDTDKLITSSVSSIGDATDATLDLIRSGVELMVVDSISSLMPASFYTENGEMKHFSETRQIAQQARELGDYCRMVQGENFTCAVNLISQVRVDLGSQGTTKPYKPSGGKEVGHNDQMRIRLMSSKSEKKAIMGTLEYDGVLLEEVVGRQVTWLIDKNKLNGHYGTGGYDLYVLGDEVGIDRIGEVLDYGIKYGEVQKKGAWLYIGDEGFQGRPKAVKYLKENPEIVSVMEANIVAKCA